MAGAQGEISNRATLQDSVKTLRSEGRYSEARTLAEILVAVVSQDSTAHSYEIVDAQLILAAITTAGRLSRQDQMALAEADSLGRLIEDLYSHARYSEAEDHAERQIAIYERLFALDHPDVATGLNDLAAMCYAQGRYAQAEPLYQRSLAIREKALGPDHPDVVSGLVSLAGLYLSTGHPDSAATVLAIAANRCESARLRVGRGLKRTTFQESPYPALAMASLLNGMPAQAWPATEKACGRALADLLLATGRRPLTEAELAGEDSLAIAVKKLEPRLATLIKGAHADSSAEAKQRVQTTRLELLAADARWSEFAQAMARKYPLAEGQSYPLERVQAGLGEKQAIVGWLDFQIRNGEYVSWAYVVHKQGPVTWVQLPGSGGAGTNSPFYQARACREALRPVEDPDTAVAAFSRVRIQPLLSVLEGAEELIVIPTGAMATIPIEALKDDQGRQLVERFTIS